MSDHPIKRGGLGQSRIRVALGGLLVFLLILRFPTLHALFPLSAMVFAALGAREFHRFGRLREVTVSMRFEMVASVALTCVGLLHPDLFERAIIPALLALIVGTFMVQMAIRGEDDAVRAVPYAFFGPVYVGLPLALGIQVLYTDRLFLLFGLSAIWMADTGAYFAGRLFGNHRLAPSISPNKTVEGLLGGIAACLLLCAFFKWGAPREAFPYTWPTVLAVGVLVAVLAPIGDLAESVLKRDAGMKDSGRAFAGHGGILDRLDSMLFCMGATYSIMRLKGLL